MNLVLFDDALQHLTRIHRVIRMDQGHALLVGVGGSGRQSCARLAAYAAGCEVFEITLSRGYGEEEFREDLKSLYNKLGIENKKVCVNVHVCTHVSVYVCVYMHSICMYIHVMYYFYRRCFCLPMVMWLKKVGIKNTHTCTWWLYRVIIVTGFLELINNMLTSGMVPALFADDEKDQIIGQVRMYY